MQLFASLAEQTFYTSVFPLQICCACSYQRAINYKSSDKKFSLYFRPNQYKVLHRGAHYLHQTKVYSIASSSVSI